MKRIIHKAASDQVSFSDYVQRVDPDLYDSITDRYNSLK